MPTEKFNDPQLGLSREEKSGQLIERYLKISEGKTLADRRNWLKINEALRREQMYVVEASDAAFWVQVKFSPESNSGSYILNDRINKSKENGSLKAVVTLPSNLPSPQTAPEEIKVLPFQCKFFLMSVSAPPNSIEKVWFIGFDEPKEVKLPDKPFWENF